MLKYTPSAHLNPLNELYVGMVCNKTAAGRNADNIYWYLAIYSKIDT